MTLRSPHRSLLTCALTCAVASAQTWTEVGDAGDRIDNPNVTIGDGPLARIDGVLTPGTPTAFDVDLFLIRVDDPATFRASTVGGAGYDTQLWLFDRQGYGVAFRDDDPGVLQSTLSGQFLSGPGVVLLGISHFDNDARDESFQELWQDQPFEVERAPDGPGAAAPLFQWNSNSGSTPAGPYTVFLSGATFAGSAAAEEPAASWAWVFPQSYGGQASFVPDQQWQHTPTDELIRVNRTGTGRFEVLFPESTSEFDAMFEASSYAGNHATVIRAWYMNNGKLVCEVDVYDTAGNPVDAAFTIRHRGPGRPDDRAAFCWANDETAGQYTPATPHSWNGNRADPTITRYGAGLYRVRFPDLGIGFQGGTFGATAFGNVGLRAQIDSWGIATGSDDLDVFVRTFDVAGNQVDSRFVVSFHTQPGTTVAARGSGAYGYANQPTAASYAGAGGYTSSNGTFGANTVTINRVGTGAYQVDMPGVTWIESSVATVVAREQNGKFATVLGWQPYQTGTRVNVRTYDAVGAPADAEFFLNYDTNQPAGSPAKNTVIGAGCGGLTLTPDNRPTLGAGWGVSLTTVPASAAIGLVMIGFTNPNVELGFLGAPGCWAYQDLVELSAVPLPAPSPSYVLAVPSSSSLIGTVLYAQGGAFSIGAGTLDLLTSNGIAATLGDV